MRGRFVYGEQTMSMPCPDALEASSGPANNIREEPFSPGQSEEAVSLKTMPIPSPLTTFLTRKELVPFVLALEKSLLVSKEHDYAKAPDRVAIFQATTILERTAETTDHDDATRTGEFCGSSCSRVAPCDELLNCCDELTRLRYSLLRRDENVTSRHLREVVSLQASLVRKQQEQLYCKDRELASIRKDRDQLEARLERMERRLAVHQKRNTATANAPDTDSHSATPSTPSSLNVSRRHSRTESLIHSERHSRSSSVERSRSRLRQSSHSGTPISQDESSGGKKSARKRLRTEESVVSNDSPTIKRVRKPQKLAEIRTKLEYGGLGLLSTQDGMVLPLSANHMDSFGKNIEDTVNKALSSTHMVPNDTLSNHLLPNHTTIVVPSWRLHMLEPLDDSCTNPEDIADDMFSRRHKKHEEDEKRRKRWDLQRARALLEHQELLKKYNKKSGGVESTVEKKDKIFSFLPKLDEIEEIEILPTVTVSAFGHPLPLLKKSEFELPWFDLDVREARENVRTTRSKARATRTSAGSSDDT